MLQTLKTEWLKIRNYKVFLIITIFFIIGVFTTNYIVYVFFENMVKNSDAKVLISQFNPYDFNYVWQTTCYTSGFIIILPVLLLIILVTNEFTFKTNRQNIIDGWSRTEFIDVKMMLALLFAFFSTFLVFITALIFGFSSHTSFSMNGFSHLGFFFLKSLSYNLFAVFISVLIKRTGFAIGVFFIYMGAENIVSQLLDVWSMKIKDNSGTDLGSMGDYLPMNASDGLLTFPDNPLKTLAKHSLPTDYTNLVIAFACVYMCMFFWFGRRIVLKRDL